MVSILLQKRQFQAFEEFFPNTPDLQGITLYDQCGKSNEADKEEKERWGEKPSAVWDRSSTLNNAHPNPTKSTKINATRFNDFTFENYLMIESLPCTVWQEHENVEALHLPILCT